ncbi:MAG: PilZ domain-containing protein [Candidatus Omnitrophota bacterium]|nr:PilZ domain-containing protein [Candidatus Omnitrophota bacterium]MBU1929585.1 PilZ domain-containing protein [Candidatus Omnitrophota bacterium]MBU2034778.1 PilZ domain-containing protein [Candidatus Omnitrophota bacterium]MBU2221948.1 PilZ domain-containing protein [Candidatus Omnitrophota bacterium]
MKEKRKFNRINKKDDAFYHKGDGKKEKCIVLDISAGGMKVALDNKLEPGNSIFGQFQILPGLGHFYICGEVVWVKGREVGVKFNKVSTIPL